MEVDYLTEGLQFFFMILILSMIVIGLPATVWKLLCVLPLRPTNPAGRKTLLGKSVVSTTAAGATSIFVFSVMFGYLKARVAPMSESVWIVVLVTAVMLVLLVAAVEWRAFRQFTTENGRQTLGASCIWLLVGNLWILWALWLMLLASAMWTDPAD